MNSFIRKHKILNKIQHKINFFLNQIYLILKIKMDLLINKQKNYNIRIFKKIKIGNYKIF
jgi:hypothetical protein